MLFQFSMTDYFRPHPGQELHEPAVKINLIKLVCGQGKTALCSCLEYGTQHNSAYSSEEDKVVFSFAWIDVVNDRKNTNKNKS